MASNYVEWDLRLIDRRTNKPIDDDSGVCNVLTEDDPSEVTIYSDAQGTSASNPLTMTDGQIRFFTDSATTAVDLSVLTANGHSYFLESISQSDHRIVVDPDKTEYLLVLPYQVVGASETVVDTGFDLSANMLVKNCFVHVTTVGTGAAIDIGTSTATDGFVDGVLVTTTGYPATLIEEALVSGSSLHGALLSNTSGGYVRKYHVRANATSGANITYINTTSSSTAGEGYIYFEYVRVPA